MENNELIRLRELIDEVAYSSTKNEAKPILQRLKFTASKLASDLEPNPHAKLMEVIGHAAEASGSVRNKDHWLQCMDRAWYVFESDVKE